MYTYIDDRYLNNISAIAVGLYWCQVIRLLSRSDISCDIDYWLTKESHEYYFEIAK